MPKRMRCVFDLIHKEGNYNDQCPESFKWFVDQILKNGWNILHNNSPVGDSIGRLEFVSCENQPEEEPEPSLEAGFKSLVDLISEVKEGRLCWTTTEDNKVCFWVQTPDERITGKSFFDLIKAISSFLKEARKA
jgi:hypothetical protein